MVFERQDYSLGKSLKAFSTGRGRRQLLYRKHNSCLERSLLLFQGPELQQESIELIVHCR